MLCQWQRILGALIMAAFISWFPGAGRAEKNCSEPVETTEGLVKGVSDADHAACAWKGIPYAAPPIGELRWRAPKPALKHEGALEASLVGFACPQTESLTSGGEARGFDEDCLTLNLWSPKKSGSFPVMFWIHGGAFRQGTGTYEMYDGARLSAERDVVVVTINYRIGPFGFLALPELAEEDENNSTGNYGLLDQIQALKWVKDNIESFGGDPNNVTIFGQSAGGMSVTYLLVSPPAAGLFQRAINMSGPYKMIPSLADGYSVGREYAAERGCAGPDPVGCLRAQPVDKLVLEESNVLFDLGISHLPHIDGHVIPADPLELMKKGEFNRVPVMAGCTRDELRLYTMSLSGLGLMPRAVVNAIINWGAGDKADAIKSMYSYDDYRRPVDLMLAVMIDAVFGSPIFEQVEALSGQVPVYFYRFDWDQTRMPHKMGAFHGLDIPFVFGALELDSSLAKMLTSKKAVKNGKPLSETMMSYYTNFARNADPNGKGLPEWQAYDQETRERIYLDTPITVKPLSDEEIERYQYFSSHSMEEVFSGVLK